MDYTVQDGWVRNSMKATLQLVLLVMLSLDWSLSMTMGLKTGDGGCNCAKYNLVKKRRINNKEVWHEIYFWLRQELKESQSPSVRSVQTCLEQSIFIYLGQRASRVLRVLSPASTISCCCELRVVGCGCGLWGPILTVPVDAWMSQAFCTRV